MKNPLMRVAGACEALTGRRAQVLSHLPLPMATNHTGTSVASPPWASVSPSVKRQRQWWQ